MIMGHERRGEGEKKEEELKKDKIYYSNKMWPKHSLK